MTVGSPDSYSFQFYVSSFVIFMLCYFETNVFFLLFQLSFVLHIHFVWIVALVLMSLLSIMFI